jgi:hypothetical protein
MQTAVQRSNSWALTKPKVNVPKMVTAPTNYLNAGDWKTRDADSLTGSAP